MAASQVERLNLWLPIAVGVVASSLTGGATIGVMGGGVADNAGDIVRLEALGLTRDALITDIRIARGEATSEATSERRAINDRLDRIVGLLDGLANQGSAIVSLQAALKTAEGNRGTMDDRLGEIARRLENHSEHPQGAHNEQD